MAESTKFNKAVDRANGDTKDTGAAMVNTTPMLMRKGVKMEEVEALFSSGEYEFAPQNMSLEEEGDMIEGILEGYGPDAEFTDPATGVVRTVQTWIVATPDGSQRAGILSSAQLDRKLPPFIGSPVKIIRGKNLKTSNGFKVADYLVAGPKMKDGKRRECAMTKPAVIEAHEAPQLPAGAQGQPATAATPTNNAAPHTAS